MSTNKSIMLSMLRTAFWLIVRMQLSTRINTLLMGKIECSSCLSMFELTRKCLIGISGLEPYIKRLQMHTTDLAESTTVHVSLCNNQLGGLTLLRDNNSNQGLLLKLHQLPLLFWNSNLLLLIPEKWLGQSHGRWHLLCRQLWPYILYLTRGFIFQS